MNTYINDNVDVTYPFFDSCVLPFPKSLFIGMNICIRRSTTEEQNPIYVSSVSITDDLIIVVVSTSKQIIGTFEASRSNYSKASLIIQRDSQIEAFGYLQLGIIPTDLDTSYSGTFYLDPMCVLYISEDVYGSYAHFYVNGNAYKIGTSFNISAYGLQEFTGNKIHGVSGIDPESLMYFNTTISYSNITSLNNISAIARTEELSDINTTQTIKTALDSHISFNVQNGASVPDTPTKTETREQHAGKVTIVEIHGSKEFPNCYDSTQDEA